MSLFEEAVARADAKILDLDRRCAELERQLKEERDKNNFDAKRLRRISSLLGLSVPESDEVLLACAGTVLGQAASAIEAIFEKQ